VNTPNNECLHRIKHLNALWVADLTNAIVGDIRHHNNWSSLSHSR